MTTDKELERQLFKVQPSELTGKHIATALRDLREPIKAAQEKLKNIPLKEIIDPMTGVEKWARFATAEELQKILNETCFGKVVVDTMPIALGNRPSVAAYVLITTSEGIVRLPGSFASQTVDIVSGEKSLLWAETRAVRRALRALGLRAETDFFDSEEIALQNKAEAKEEAPKTEIKTTQAKDAEVSSEVKAKSGTRKKPVSKGKAGGTTIKKATRKSKVKPEPLKLPNEAINIQVDRDAPGFPNRRSSTYYNKLMDGLREARTELGVNVDVFVKHVFGRNAFSDRKITLQSLTTEELEMMFQYYILDKESEI